MAVAALGLQVVALYGQVPPGVSAGFEVPGLDKAVHVGLFAVTVWALLWVLPARVAVALMVLQAGVSEWVQSRFIPGRSGDVWDLVADGVGIAAGWWGWRATASGRRGAGGSG